MKFQAGDRVRCLKRYGEGSNPGDTGTVLLDGKYLVKVEWDEFMDCRHDCGGLCEHGYGWNVPRENLELLRLELDLGELPVLNITDLLI